MAKTDKKLGLVKISLQFYTAYFATSLLFSCLAAAKLVNTYFIMDIKECFDKFLEFSLISYDSFETIFNNKDAVYKEFTDYAISYCGQNKETIYKFFYGELIPACKEWIMDEKLEQINEDFND